jgi:hypothetical protein
LHDEAKGNVLSYVNEVDGIKEEPSIHSHYDPFSHLHYLLGREPTQGALSLPFRKWIELKIDYGDTYENVRIRKGYSRLPGDKLYPQKEGLDKEDSRTLEDILAWSVDDLESGLAFLESLTYVNLEPGLLIRSMVFTVHLYERLRLVKEECRSVDMQARPLAFCDNGFTTMEENDLVNRLLRMIRTTNEFISTKVNLYKILLQDEVFRKILAHFLNVDANALHGWTENKIKDEVEAGARAAAVLNKNN